MLVSCALGYTVSYSDDTTHSYRVLVMCAQVLPMVYFGILDHYSRRSIRDARVIGTLLGTEVGGVTEVTNYFPVPHQESDVQVRYKLHHPGLGLDVPRLALAVTHRRLWTYAILSAHVDDALHMLLVMITPQTCGCCMDERHVCAGSVPTLCSSWGIRSHSAHASLSLSLPAHTCPCHRWR